MKSDTKNLSAKPYVIGFAGSLVLTLSAYLSITHHIFSRKLLIATITLLALVQFAVQMVLFLHLGRDKKEPWRMWVFLAMGMVVIILVFGSIWIMNNLNYHMNLQQMYQYLNNQGDGI